MEHSQVLAYRYPCISRGWRNLRICNKILKILSSSHLAAFPLVGWIAKTGFQQPTPMNSARAGTAKHAGWHVGDGEQRGTSGYKCFVFPSRGILCCADPTCFPNATNVPACMGVSPLFLFSAQRRCCQPVWFNIYLPLSCTFSVGGQFGPSSSPNNKYTRVELWVSIVAWCCNNASGGNVFPHWPKAERNKEKWLVSGSLPSY